MNQDTQRWLDRWIGIPLCAVLSVVHALSHALRRPKTSRPPRNILIVLLSEMGSLVLAYPMLQSLKTKYPGAKLHALMFSKNQEVMQLLGVQPEINVITIRDHALRPFVGDTLAALAAMRKLQIDTVIDCELFSRVSSLLCGLSGARRRVGFHRHTQEGLYRGSFMTRKVLYNPHHHIADQFLSLVCHRLELKSARQNGTNQR